MSRASPLTIDNTMVVVRIGNVRLVALPPAAKTKLVNAYAS